MISGTCSVVFWTTDRVSYFDSIMYVTFVMYLGYFVDLMNDISSRWTSHIVHQDKIHTEYHLNNF